ncbi:MAG: hypothetical protein A2Y12_03335 [Planctomycetes bacterium GWF2_42_9]|nr:MAG: hypothetical protein A2Y12_03335 [Planctomycetes bacterium GWF2_42_9]
MIQGTSKDPALFMPSHRAHIRWFYADYTQQANINMLRWYPDGTSYPSFADVADEMGMLLKTSASFEILTQRLWCWDEQGNYLESEADKVMDWVLVQLDYLKNHPSIAMWSTSNENFTVRSKEPATKLEKEIVSAMLRMSEKAQKFDPTRVDHLQGTNGLIYKGMTDDPRLQVVDGHYVELDVFKDWKNKYGKPCSEGEISLGGDFAWTYQNEALASINEGKDPTEKFWRRLNSGTKTVAQRIQYWRSIELPGIWPFEGCMTYHPLMEIWPNVKFGQMTPVVNWPAQSGPDTKPESYVNGRTSYNFWDTNSPRTMHLRTYDALKDNFKEVPKLQPKFSPEIIVQVIDENDNPVYNSIVWLIPTNQPTGPLGSLTDKQGKAWFWCKAGGGEYTAWVKINENWYSTKVEPAVMGEWMQVKTVRTKVLNTR